MLKEPIFSSDIRVKVFNATKSHKALEEEINEFLSGPLELIYSIQYQNTISNGEQIYSALVVYGPPKEQ